MTEVTEQEVMIPASRTIKLTDGSTYEIPPINWGREIRVLKVVKSIMQEVMHAGIFVPVRNDDGVIVERPEAETMMLLTEFVLDKAPSQLTEAASAICSQKKEWVEEKLTIETVLEVVLPFLQSKQALIQKQLSQYLPTVKQT